MAGGVADIVEVVVLAASAHALLRRGGAHVGALLLAGEDVLELHHAGVREHQRRIVLRDERRGRHDVVAVLLEEVQECRPDLVDAAHERLARTLEPKLPCRTLPAGRRRKAGTMKNGPEIRPVLPREHEAPCPDYRNPLRRAGRCRRRHPRRARLEDLLGDEARVLTDHLLDLRRHVGVVAQERLGVLASLADAGGSWLNQAPDFSTMPGLDAEIDELAHLRDALAVHDVELDLLEGRGHLVLDHLHARRVADDLVALLDRADAADIETDGGVELERVATRRGLGRTVHHADLHADLVDEDTMVFERLIEPVSLRSAWLMSRACRPGWTSPISPSISERGTSAATESTTTTTSTAPERTSVSQISSACSPVSGCEIRRLVEADAQLAAHKWDRAHAPRR